VRSLRHHVRNFYAPKDPRNLGIRALEITFMNVEMISRAFDSEMEYDIQRGGSRIRKGFKTYKRIDRRGKIPKNPEGKISDGLALIGDWVVFNRGVYAVMPREEFEAVFETTPYLGKKL